MGPVSPDRASPGARGPGSVAGSPSVCGLPNATADLLEGAGFNVAARLPIEAYDALVPDPWRSATTLRGARSAFVLGTAGGDFESAWIDAAETMQDPADAHARDACARAIRSLEAETGERACAWLYADRRNDADGRPVFADFVALAAAGELGVRSPLGLLIHSAFGPWWSVRALILTTWAPDPTRVRVSSPIAADLVSCQDCPAPCIDACPAGAVQRTGFDLSACGAKRLEDEPCAGHCAARRACIVGPAHAYPERVVAHYAAASLEWIRAGTPQFDPIP